MGDLKTKFYHALTKQQCKAHNKISGLHDKSGQQITEDKGVGKVDVEYFEEFI